MTSNRAARGNPETMSSTSMLGSSAAQGVTVTMGGQMARVAIQTVSLVVMSHLLSPGDYGLLAATLTVVGLGEVFRDFGLSQSAVQAPSLSRQQRDNLFWLNTGMGMLLATLLTVAAPYVAAFFGDGRLVAMTRWMSLIFVFNGVATQYRAGLTRNLRFTALALTDTLSPVFGLAIGATMALAGCSYWSLVGLQLGTSAGILTVSLLVCRWIPGWFSRSQGTRWFVTFGTELAGAQLLGYASRTIDSVLVGRVIGVSALGVYDRAFAALMLPLNQINAPSSKVAMPLLARLRDDSEKYNRYLLTGQSVLVNVVMLLLSLSSALAYPLIPIFLGSQWNAVVPLYRILAIAGFAQVAAYSNYWVFVSKARTRSFLHYSIVARPITIVCICVGCFFGVQGVAWGYAAGLLIVWPLGLAWTHPFGDIPTKRMLGNACRAFGAHASCGVVAYLVCTFLIHTAGLIPIASAAAGALAYALMLAFLAGAWPLYRADLRGVVHVAHLIRGRRVIDSSLSGPPS